MIKKQRYTSILILISININAADSFIKSSDGYMRLGYQKDDAKHTDIALGGKLHFETNSWNNISAGASFYTSNRIQKHEGAGVPFFNTDNHSYTFLGEAYLQGTWGNNTLKVGRQEIDTPFADTDDIGMIPNTFEATLLTNKTFEKTTIVLGQLQKWSGVDSDKINQFSTLNDSKGVQVLGVTYEGFDQITLSGWLYNIPSHVQIGYFDALYETEDTLFTYSAAAQYIIQDYDNNTKSTVYGIAGSIGHKASGLTASVAYNKVDGIAAENFFGGGPYFTNAEHHTLSEAGKDGDNFLYGLEWDVSILGINGLTLGANIDSHSNGSFDNTSEYDFVVNYEYDEKLNFSAIYSDIDDNSGPFTNLRIFINYLF